MILIFYSYSGSAHTTFIVLVYVREQYKFHYIISILFATFFFMIKTIFFYILIMSILLISVILLVSQFVPVLNFCIFGQPKLECKPCICHPECHCETKCVQQQIMKDCNLGVDSHNALASHHTGKSYNTRHLSILFDHKFSSNTSLIIS
jgi:hypothetical protein